MAKTIDTRGLACPQPVILTRRALQEGDEVTTIVDNETARFNVTRFVEKRGYNVRTENRDDGVYLHISGPKTIKSEPAAQPMNVADGGSPVLIISDQFMGRGDDELGHLLIRGFFHTLNEVEPIPNTIIFFNSGAKLTTQGSPILDDLQALSRSGVEILTCGTCLAHFELKEKLAVGEVSNMYTIAETMLKAGKVIKL